jgi:hypothetical protein
MKTTKILLILLAAAAIFSSACDELLGDLLKFNSQWYSIDFPINPSDELGYLVFTTDTIEVDIDSVLEANGLSADNIGSAKMSDAKVTILTEGCNFDPVENVELFIETSNLGSTMIAWLDEIPSGATMIELDLNLDDLQDYLLEDEFIFTAKGTLLTKVDKTVDLTADLRWIIRGSLGQ